MQLTHLPHRKRVHAVSASCAHRTGLYVLTAPLHNLLSKHLLCVQKGKGRKQKSPPPQFESDDLLLFKDCSNLPAGSGKRPLLGATGNTQMQTAAGFPWAVSTACERWPQQATVALDFCLMQRMLLQAKGCPLRAGGGTCARENITCCLPKERFKLCTAFPAVLIQLGSLQRSTLKCTVELSASAVHSPECTAVRWEVSCKEGRVWLSLDGNGVRERCTSQFHCINMSC